MDYDVLKAFNTVNRRLTPGAGPGGTISDADEIAPFTFGERLENKFIRPKSADADVVAATAEVPPNKMASPVAKSAPVTTDQ